MKNVNSEYNWTVGIHILPQTKTTSSVKTVTNETLHLVMILNMLHSAVIVVVFVTFQIDLIHCHIF